jgi:hypothetical protein
MQGQEEETQAGVRNQENGENIASIFSLVNIPTLFLSYLQFFSLAFVLLLNLFVSLPSTANLY